MFACQNLPEELPSSANLPDELWKLILTHVPLRQRLCVCASVSKQLHRAALAATDQIVFGLDDNTMKADCFWQWMDHHGQLITDLCLLGPPGAPGAPLLSARLLPSPNLRQLDLSYCSAQLAPSSSQPGVLQVCTGLTKLLLKKCRLVGGPTSLAAALLAAPTLRHLELHSLWHDRELAVEDICFISMFDLPAAVLSCLQQLTCLKVRETEVSIQHISCLRKLQQLSLEDTFGISPSRTQSLGQLTALQHLDLKLVTCDPAALHGCTSLQCLSLSNVEIINDSGSYRDDARSLLDLITHLQLLQELELSELPELGPAAPCEYTALSASSKLQQLRLSCNLPAGVWHQGVFKPGQQLPELHSFKLSTGEAGPASFGQQDVGALISCCPALRFMDIPIQSSVQLAALAQLTALEQLSIKGADAISCSSLSGLSDLTRLSMLSIQSRGGLELSTATLLPLTLLCHLARLEVAAHNYLQCTTGQGPASTPDVWQQLLEHCRTQQHQEDCLSDKDDS